MGNPRGVPGDFDALEKRRFEFERWYERGETLATIARRRKTGYTTVYCTPIVLLAKKPCRNPGVPGANRD